MMPIATTTPHRPTLISDGNRLWAKYSRLPPDARRKVVQAFGLPAVSVGLAPVPTAVTLSAARTEWDLALANWLDAAFRVVNEGTEAAVLHVANELDRLGEAIAEQAKRVADAIHSEALFWLAVLGAGAFFISRTRRPTTT